jgi:endoglucanase
VSWGTASDRQAVVQNFEKAQAWSRKEQRPLYLGEFGAYDKAEMSARARYTDCVAREAEQRGWSWAYWQFDSDFIVYDIPHKRWVQPIRDALIPVPGR